MAFIVDSYGLDDTAFNSSIDAIVNFVNLYNMSNLQILLIENTNEIFKHPAFISYTNITFLRVTAYNQELNGAVLADLREIAKTKTAIADDWYKAMMKMVDVAQTTDIQERPKPPHRPACTDVQASIFIAVDLSKGVNGSIRDQMQSILRLFPTAFNVAYDISVTKQGCSEEDKKKALETYKGYSRMSGWTFFGSTRGVNDPTFCVSNLASVMSSVGNDGGDEPPNYERGRRNLLKMFNDTLSNKCKCSRYDDPTTKKIVIWMPVHSYEPKETNKYEQFFNYPYKHYVIPFGKDYDLSKNDFYYGLSQNKGTLDGLLSVKDLGGPEGVVKELWKKICKQFKNDLIQPAQPGHLDNSSATPTG
ncbi:hypothetical protein ANCDUO_05289 [Ancylostoma duodenale]|uniref:Uncharacterized protein n=1 Tax=Ancylostoma duodenale TaxID=51022 RepID=A0A0C2DP14_9BILA|nr:hypothetical protein ANCDUO_05289 [Ancylostoma duodenale]